jgi:hypothetical protein
MIDTNLRSVKRVDGFYTTETMAQAGKTDHLCNHCGYQAKCKQRKALERLNAKHAWALGLRNCRDFVPPLVFRDPKGTEGKFNTFRIGSTWVDRVGFGSVVALIDKGGNIYGHAAVDEVFCGDLDAMLDTHAHKNHMVLDETDAGVAREKLLGVLKNAFGSNWLFDGRPMSVIYLERIREAKGSS